MKYEEAKKRAIEREPKRKKYDELKKMSYEELKMLKHEFIHDATVKVLRLNDNLLKSPTLLMFRVHDLVEVIKDNPSTSLEQIVSFGHNTRGHLYNPPSYTTVPATSSCFSPDFFINFVPQAIYFQNLFHSDNNQLVSQIVTKYFHSCFNCPADLPSATASRPKFVLVIEVLRKFVYIGDTDGEYPRKFNLPAKELQKSSLDILRDGEDYSEAELQDVLGSVYDLKIKHGRKLSTNAPTETYRLSHVKAKIRMLTFNGKSSEHEHDQEKDECPICLKRFCQSETIAKMPCSHIFHKNCAVKWLMVHADSCPFCRSVCKTSII